jgi:hypothetical protein
MNGDHRVVTLDPNVRIIALDPGGTTGWAVWQALYIPGLESWSVNKTQSYTCGHITGPNHGAELRNFLGTQRVFSTTVVCERYQDRHNEKHDDPIAREYIGIARTWCIENDVEFVEQNAGAAKPFVKDVNLRRLGVWQGKQWKHAMDAYRHLFWFMINGAPGRKDLLKVGWPNA